MTHYRYQPLQGFNLPDVDLDDPVLRRFGELARGYGLSQRAFNSLVTGMLPMLEQANNLDDLEQPFREALQYHGVKDADIAAMTDSMRDGFERYDAGQDVPELMSREHLDGLQDWLEDMEAAGRLTAAEVDQLIDQGQDFAGVRYIEQLQAHLQDGADHPGPVPVMGTRPTTSVIPKISSSNERPHTDERADLQTEARAMMDNPLYRESSPEGDRYRERVERAFQRAYPEQGDRAAINDMLDRAKQLQADFRAYRGDTTETTGE